MKFITDITKKKELIKKYCLQQYMSLDLESISVLISFERNEYLVQAGTSSAYLYFVIKGKLSCFSYTSSEKINCVAFSQNSALIGEASSLFGDAPTVSVKALSDVLCVAVCLNEYRESLLNDLTFVRNICHQLARKINNEGRYSTTLLDPLEVRLSQFILLNSCEGFFTIQLTDCADALNSSYRHLLRIIKELCELNILTKKHNCYYIEDIIRLRKIASGEIILKT